jgi:hypothetical protein
MFEGTVIEAPGAAALAALDDVLDRFAALDLTGCSDDDLLGLMRGVEERTRRLATVDHALVGEAEARGVAGERGCRSTAALLMHLLRVSAAEASARVRAARQLAPRRAFTGEVFSPEFAQLAAAQATGTVSAAQAALITRTVSGLPDAVRDEHGESVEAFLVEQAGTFGPDTLGKLARRVVDTLDPNGGAPASEGVAGGGGKLHDAEHRRKHRHLRLSQRPDGSAYGSFELEADAAEALRTVLDALAAPKPEADGVKDPRTAEQRNHDALRDALLMILRSGELPTCNGVAATLIFTMRADDAATGSGLATTGHGATVPVREALKFLGDARIIPVETDDGGAVTGYGKVRRIFTERQRLAMLGRDKGCSFPGCTAPPAWTEAHHVTGFANLQRTCVDDGCLLCSFHHREFENLGWRCQMIAGTPHFIPPRWLDPQQKPVRNRAHDPAAPR